MREAWNVLIPMNSASRSSQKVIAKVVVSEMEYAMKNNANALMDGALTIALEEKPLINVKDVQAAIYTQLAMEINACVILLISLARVCLE